MTGQLAHRPLAMRRTRHADIRDHICLAPAQRGLVLTVPQQSDKPRANQRGHIKLGDRAAPPLKTARRPPHSRSCWLINLKHWLSITAKDARLPPLTRYRLHAAPSSISAKGFLPFTCCRGVEKGKVPSRRQIFFSKSDQQH